MPIKQSICYPLFKPDDMSLDDLCKVGCELGYVAIELWDRGPDFDEVVETATRHRLAVVSMCGHLSLPDGLNKSENHDRIETELRESIDIAFRCGIPGLICFSGNRNPGQSDYEGLVTCAHGLRRIASYAEEKGINLNVELLNSKVNHPDYQCDHTDWGIALCEMVQSERVKLLFDIYHMQIMEGDVIRSIRKHIKWIGHFHTAGNPGRNDIDDTQELNYRGICQAISQTDYDLFIGHEYKPLGDPTKSLRTTFDICKPG